MTRIRRIIIGTDIAGGMSGVETVANVLSEAFRDRGVTVERISRLESQNSGLPFKMTVHNIGKGRRYTLHNAARRHASKTSPQYVLGLLYTPIWNIQQRARVRKLLNSLSSEDAVITFSALLGNIMLPEIKNTLKKPRVERPVYIHQHHSRYGAYTQGEFYTEDLAKTVDRFLSLSAPDAQLFSQDYQIPVGYISNPIPEGAPSESVAKENTLVVISRYSEEKNIDRIIDAFHRISPEFPGWNLKIFGHGVLDEQLRRQVENLDNPAISVNGALYGEEKWQQLATARLGIMASEFEGFPMFILEGMSVGTPVISSPVSPAVEELMGECGYLAPDNSLEELEHTIRKALSDQEILRKKAARCVEIAQQYSVPAITDRWFEELSELSKND